jgi:hypothetical protein
MSTPIVRRRKRPVEVDTIQWLGDNEADVRAFTTVTAPDGSYVLSANFYALDAEDRKNSDDPDATATVYDKLHSTWILVYTGQHIVRGVAGEFYPIAEAVLADTYDLVDEKFFVPGRTYTRTLGPGLHIPTPIHLRFECVGLTSDPKIGDREAWGWVRRSNGTRYREFLFDHDYPLWTPEAGDL